MTVRAVTVTGEPVLHRRAEEVRDFNDELRQLIDDMFDTMDAAHGVGLAAPQVGVGLRVFTYDSPHEDEAPSRGVVVNPVVTLSKISGADPDVDDESEGCLSVPGLSYPLKRAGWAQVKGFDAHGNPLEFEATDWFARVIQHEFDHLDGKLYVDRLNEKWGRRARKQVRAEGWGIPSLTWLPGVDPDPFGH